MNTDVEEYRFERHYEWVSGERTQSGFLGGHLPFEKCIGLIEKAVLEGEFFTLRPLGVRNEPMPEPVPPFYLYFELMAC